MLSLSSFSWSVLINDNLVQPKKKRRKTLLFFLSFGDFKILPELKSKNHQDNLSRQNKYKSKKQNSPCVYEHSNYDLWENVPEIPMSYPNMRPLEAATMQVINTDTVILPLKSLPAPVTAKPPTGAIWFLLFLPLNFSGYKQNSQSKW